MAYLSIRVLTLLSNTAVSSTLRQMSQTRMSIHPDVKLAVTLCYLATSESIFSSSSVNINSWLPHFRGSVRCSAAVSALNLWLAIIVSSMGIATYLMSTVILIKLGHKTISGLARKWSPNASRVYAYYCLNECYAIRHYA